MEAYGNLIASEFFTRARVVGRLTKAKVDSVLKQTISRAFELIYDYNIRGKSTILDQLMVYFVC